MIKLLQQIEGNIASQKALIAMANRVLSRLEHARSNWYIKHGKWTTKSESHPIVFLANGEVYSYLVREVEVNKALTP